MAICDSCRKVRIGNRNDGDTVIASLEAVRNVTTFVPEMAYQMMDAMLPQAKKGGVCDKCMVELQSLKNEIGKPLGYPTDTRYNINYEQPKRPVNKKEVFLRLYDEFDSLMNKLIENDDSSNFYKTMHIDDGVNFGRSLGVKVFAGIQSIEQLYEIYGQSRGRNIAAGFSSVYAFRVNNTSTRDYIVSLFGKNIILEQYQMLDNKIIEEKRNGQTVEHWDLINLNIGEAIVGLPFSQPFRFQFNMYK